MSEQENPGLFLGASPDARVYLRPDMANKHGLIAGATGTGKTVSLRVIAEAFSHIGVPSLVADVKGDLSGLARPAPPNDKFDQRSATIGLTDYQALAAPTVFWDVYGESGHNLRSTISELGPLLLSRLLDLNSTQEAVLYIAFRIADDEGLLLLDLKDLRTLLTFIADNADEVGKAYGRVSTASVAAIQRSLLVLEEQEADRFFGEPAIDLNDFIRGDLSGRGIVNVLAAERLYNNPKLYATVLLWLMSELFESLPEVGDPEKPVLALFFDEAHLLFDDAPKVLVDKVEQVVRLIRSKGVSVFFVTQNPLDLPDSVLGQLGNRVQHALRAFTPRDQKAVRSAAETFRSNPKLDTAGVIMELGVGEALVSTLDRKGRPTPVERTLIRPPETALSPITGEERAAEMKNSPVGAKYNELIDRESAHELLTQRAQQELDDAAKAAGEEEEDREFSSARRSGSRYGSGTRSRPARPKGRRMEEDSGGLLETIFGSGSSRRQSVGEAMVKSAARSLGSQIGRSIGRGLLGGIFRGR